MTSHEEATYATTEAIFIALAGHGVVDVFISPGSRSGPLAITASTISGIDTHVVLDERSAAFVALGMATVTGRPVALVCTSGSATAHYLPAIVEANKGRVPLVILTADRPPGFLERDAPQTIDQDGLYGIHVRASVSLPVAHEVEAGDAGALVSAAVAKAHGPDAGPVHINCPFDKPLEPPNGWTPGEIVPGSLQRATIEASSLDIEAFAAFTGAYGKGVIVAGPRRSIRRDLETIEKLGWPILADPLSGFRQLASDLVVSGAELLVRSEEFVAQHQPDAVIRTGATPTGRGMQDWLEAIDVPAMIVDPDLRWTATGPEAVLRSQPAALIEAMRPAPQVSDWVDSWRDAEHRVQTRRDHEHDEHPESEVSITRMVIESDPDLLWVASSMPIRHVDVVLDKGRSTVVCSNRGANGIDGTIASAVGAAMGTHEPVTLLAGDLAFLHDAGSLTAAIELGVDLTIVVIDNRGGAIFSMLPVAGRDVDFKRLFTAPHHRDLVAIANGYGAEASRVTVETLAEALTPAAGVRVFVVDADPGDTHEAYRRMVGG